MQTVPRVRRTTAACNLLLMGLTSSYPVFADNGLEPLLPGTFGPAILLLLAALLLWLGLRLYQSSPYGYLYLQQGNTWKRFSIKNELTRIGRHPNNELQLSDKSISRFHAEIIRHKNGTFSIYDVTSTNGVRVGLRPVRSSFLRDGDMIDLGSLRFKFTRLPRDYKLHERTQVLNLPLTRFDKRRRHEYREDTRIQVRLYSDDSGWINGWMRNTGRDGAFVETDAKLASRLPVDLVAAVVEGTRRRWLHISAEVVWSDSKGLGIRFTDSNPDALDELVGLANTPDSSRPTLH